MDQIYIDKLYISYRRVSGGEAARLCHLIVIAPVFGLETVDRNRLPVVGG